MPTNNSGGVPTTFTFSLPKQGDNWIVTLSADGEIRINPKYLTDEAAAAFWLAVKKLAEADGYRMKVGIG